MLKIWSISSALQTHLWVGRVQRAERGKEVIGANHQTELARLIEAPFALRAEAYERTADLLRRANEPIQKLVEKDSAALTAITDLRERRIASLEAILRPRNVQHTFAGPPLPSLIPSLHSGINVFASPFDFQVTGPNREDVVASANRLNGTFRLFYSGDMAAPGLLRQGWDWFCRLVQPESYT